jgi:competence protein ComGC
METCRSQSSHHAFSLTELLVIVAVLALLAGLLLPALKKAKVRGGPSCVSYLKQVGLAFQMWSSDNDDKSLMQGFTNLHGNLDSLGANSAFCYFQMMSNELSAPVTVICPVDNRMRATNFANLRNDNVSYFVGVDANEDRPQMFLAGDRNLTISNVQLSPSLVTIKSTDSVGWSDKIHRGQGNVAVADGSVQQYTSSALQQATRAGTNANRLAIP